MKYCKLTQKQIINILNLHRKFYNLTHLTSNFIFNKIPNFTYEISSIVNDEIVSLKKYNCEQKILIDSLLIWREFIWLSKKRLLLIYGLPQVLNKIFNTKNKIENIYNIFHKTINNIMIQNLSKIQKHIKATGKFPCLYKIDKRENLKIWHIYKVEINDTHIGATWYYKYGNKDGKIIKRHKYVRTGKNIGKKNETTAYEQAVLDGLSKFNNKIKKDGYMTDPQLAEISSKQFSPMLVSKWKSVKNIPSFPLLIQNKLDGHRMFIKVELKTKKIIIYKKNMDETKLFNQTIRKDLEKMFSEKKNIGEKNLWLDGEVFNIENNNFNTLSSVLNTDKYDNLSKKQLKFLSNIKFYIFDLYSENDPELTYIHRYHKIKDIIGNNKKYNYVKYLQAIKVKNNEKIEKKLREQTKKGYEGIVIKDPNGKYGFGRSIKYGVYKYKLKEDDEGQIIKIEQKEGNPGIVFTIKDKFDVIFKITGNGSHNYQNKVLENKDNYINKKIRYKYDGKLEDGKPKFPKPILKNNKYIISEIE
jgi:DNA ligase-1